MIKTARQLKDKIKNIANGDSTKSQILMRKYVMERFLARVATSKYKNNFILKGGMLVSAIVGEEARSTMDIDTTLRSLPLTDEDVKNVIREIASINLSDNLTFEFVKTEEIMETHDYPGIKVTISAFLEKLRETITIDISTGDKITPSAIEFSYPMMFEQDSINIWSYNLETLLAEKLETVLSRSSANTRMRDFYDIHILWNYENHFIDRDLLREAYYATAQKRGTQILINDAEEILLNIANDEYMPSLWNNYKNSNNYVGDMEWDDVVETVRHIILDEIPLDHGFEMTMI